MSFDFAGARKAGYTDDEITGFLAESNPNFDVEAARKSGYSPEEISSFLSSEQQKVKSEPEKNLAQKAFDKTTRLITQGTIGGIQAASVGYDIPAIVSRKLSIANAPSELRQSIFSDIETLQESKARGEWSPQHQEEYDALVDLIKDPKKMDQFLPKEEDVPHYDVGSLIESGAKKFGVDLTPQGADEMALRWIGFIKNPSKAQELLKNGFNPKNAKELLKAIAPTGKEALRGAGAGTAIQIAAENELGPIGTMAAAVIGDAAPSLGLKTLSTAGKAATKPVETAKSAIESGKKIAAKGVVAFTPKDKLGMQKALIEDFKNAGIQADAGTITGNNLVKWVQSTLAQSGLTGAPLEEFKKNLTQNIVSEYKNITSGLGESIYESKYEAGEALKTGLKEARDIDYAETRNIYQSAKERAADSQVYAGNVAEHIKLLEDSLEPGSFKSAEQQAVLDIINKVKKDVATPDGTYKSAFIRDLVNDKIALNDAIDYEVQGGAKSLLKQVVSEIDKAILSHAKEDPTFAKEWSQANEKFSKHAKTYRGDVIKNALKTQDPSLIFNKMNTPHGINEIRKALSVTPEGRELFNSLAQHKMQEMIGNNMVDGITNQLNFGKFSKILEKGQNRAIAKSLLGEDSFKRLEKLQNVSGRIAETAQKFLNTSRSGVHATDLAFAGKIVSDIANIFAGNPWPLVWSGGSLIGAKTAAKLMVDPKFLQLLEEAVMESGSGSSKALENAGKRLAERIRELEEPAIAGSIVPSSQKS